MLSLVCALLAVVTVNGLGVYWPSQVAEVTLADGTKFLGRMIRSEVNPDTDKMSVQFKVGNREQDPQRQDFRWIRYDAILAITYPAEVYVLERVENGDFYGYLKDTAGPDLARLSGIPVAEAFPKALGSVRSKSSEEIAPISKKLLSLGNELQKTQDKILRLTYRRDRLLADSRSGNQSRASDVDRQIAELQASSQKIKEQSDRLVGQQQLRLADLRRDAVVMTNPAGKETSIALVDIVRFHDPNAMGFWAKSRYYLSRIGELLWENPRESNTEGGLFPAIFGTVMLIFLMAIACFPLGVLAGIYLGEYAKEGFLIRLVRIAVNNLAGIPSIVYGIFGLGFFVYGVGGLLDQWFFPERVASGTPTFGTGGILWASLTLGLLTVPVVIVSTEEALQAIPRAAREGSFALGATKFQTLVRVLLPTASPGMMTGFILAMARAAGEVAPLMITGVVKLAPQMPVDGDFPFFHLDRKFMHLGFHIYDVGFQSPNVEASKPMVFVTTLLLLIIVLAMTSVAIYLRNRMRRRYQVRTI
ncbi:MAG: phosphate ABC transporter permease PstA [Pirellulales bacterium]|nr:phosphate ABC transporter permease PstA [Pirellulales bacterium]